MRFKDFLAVGMLMLTAYFSLATSTPQDPASPTTGTYYILSDCGAVPVDSVITVSANTIILPSGVSFTDFGFPQTVIGQTVLGLVNGLPRECTVTYGEDGSNHVDNRWLYSCFDSGKYRCSIFVKPQ